MKILNVGVIGLGMGKVHAEGVKETEGACLYAVCDTNPDRANEVAKELSVPHVFTDYRDLIADSAIDAVIIASPDQDHREMVVNTLNAGKHILCEKPLALTREDCEAIVEAAQKSDRKFMVGQICRYTPGFKQAKEIIDSGAIGELTFIESEYAHDYSSIYARGSWRSDPARNGVVGGGCHAVDLLRWIAGNPDEVVAYSTHKTFASVTPYDDTHIAILKFPNGVIGKVFVSISCKRDYTMRSVFYGTKGTIIVDNTSPTMTVFRQDVFPGMDRHDMPIAVPVQIKNHNAAGEFKEFYDIIVNDKPVSTTVYEGANTIAACLAIVESADQGKMIKPVYFQ
ncbi:MAG: Gfo/Idh/MocA family oxidoreductase [Clostridiaceae bacterium]|nr:Gfo/Idh/MocA family oxidoreductase [Clostridiaceae bacterium]